MSAANNFTIIGNIGKDPELKKTAKDVSYANMSIAVSKRYKDQSGETKTVTNWFNFTLWGKKAEALVKFIQKGTKLAVTGELTTREREVEGKKITVVEFNVGDVEVLAGGKTRGEKSQSTSSTSNSQMEEDDMFDADFADGVDDF